MALINPSHPPRLEREGNGWICGTASRSAWKPEKGNEVAKPLFISASMNGELPFKVGYSENFYVIFWTFCAYQGLRCPSAGATVISSSQVFYVQLFFSPHFPTSLSSDDEFCWLGGWFSNALTWKLIVDLDSVLSIVTYFVALEFVLHPSTPNRLQPLCVRLNVPHTASWGFLSSPWSHLLPSTWSMKLIQSDLLCMIVIH
jgi:hypothetical protein